MCPTIQTSRSTVQSAAPECTCFLSPLVAPILKRASRVFPLKKTDEAGVFQDAGSFENDLLITALSKVGLLLDCGLSA